MNKYRFKGEVITASSREEAIKIFAKKTKVTSKFRPNEIDRINKCLELLEKQTEICGNHLYFELDVEKEVVKVYLNPDKKNTYLTINVGGDSPATAMYDIWTAIFTKF